MDLVATPGGVLPIVTPEGAVPESAWRENGAFVMGVSRVLNIGVSRGVLGWLNDQFSAMRAIREVMGTFDATVGPLPTCTSGGVKRSIGLLLRVILVDVGRTGKIGRSSGADTASTVTEALPGS